MPPLPVKQAGAVRGYRSPASYVHTTAAGGAQHDLTPGAILHGWGSREMCPEYSATEKGKTYSCTGKANDRELIPAPLLTFPVQMIVAAFPAPATNCVAATFHRPFFRADAKEVNPFLYSGWSSFPPLTGDGAAYPHP